MKSENWKTYRTRFLVKAKQLSSALSFVDSLGRQHSGRKGDYLVESSDGVISIAPRQIFEDIYVPMSLLGDPGTGNILIGESTIHESTIDDQPRPNTPKLDHLNFTPLKIENVKLARRPVGRQRTSEVPIPDETAPVRRKLPQSYRDRRGSTQRLSLM